MKLTIEINCNNAAFEDNESGECARILRELADRMDGYRHFSPGHGQPLRDANGNTVGEMNVEDDSPPRSSRECFAQGDPISKI